MMEHPFTMFTEEEGNHFSFVREIVKGRLYEVVAARKDSERTMEYVHTFVDMLDYNESEIDAILHPAGYGGLDDFVLSYTCVEQMVYHNGRIDRKNSSAWYVDYMLLVSIIMETIAGRSLPRKRALELLQAAVGEKVKV